MAHWIVKQALILDENPGYSPAHPAANATVYLDLVSRWYVVVVMVKVASTPIERQFRILITKDAPTRVTLNNLLEHNEDGMASFKDLDALSSYLEELGIFLNSKGLAEQQRAVATRLAKMTALVRQKG